MAAISFKRSSLEDFNKYNSLLVGNEAFSPSDFALLETQILASSASSVTFTGLDSYTDYKHLQLRTVARTIRTGTSADALRFGFNDDSAAKEAHNLYADGSKVDSSVPDTGKARFARITTDFDTSGNFAAAITDILDFSSSSKNTTYRSLNGKIGGETRVNFFSGAFFSTDPITQIEIITSVADIAAGSRFSLYGIKAA